MRPLILQSQLAKVKDLTPKQVDAITEVKEKVDKRKSIEKHYKKSERPAQIDGGPIEEMNPHKLHPVSGLKIDPKDKDRLLPHFSMLIVGKPGSGKTTMMQKLITDPKFYSGKFHKVYVVSPSIAKLDLPLPRNHLMNEFDIDLIFDKVLECNTEQERLITDIIRDKLQQVHINKQLLQDQTHMNVSLNELRQNMKSYGVSSSIGLADQLIRNKFSLNPQQAQTSRFAGNSILSSVEMNKRNLKAMEKVPNKREESRRINAKVNKIVAHADKIQRLFMETLKTQEQLDNTHKNILFVFDDVVSDIKALEHEQSLTKLFYNRRHLVANGTVSIIVVTQKYTNIPQKIRSNSNWIILFRLNPVEFESVWKDAIVLSRDHWQKILDDVFGTEEEDIALSKLSVEQQISKRRYDNLGIWVEFSNFLFKNFERLKL